MLKKLNDAYYYDPRDGGEPDIEQCRECDRNSFVISEQQCLWCGAELYYTECEDCDEPLRQDDQYNGGRCSYHAHLYDKMMRDD